MTIKTATPQETFDHMIGAGAFQWSWWLDCKVTGYDAETNTVSPDWTATITAETGDDSVASATIDHQAVLAAARKVIKESPRFASASLAPACRALVFDADEADFDAPLADELLQLLVLGEIVFG